MSCEQHCYKIFLFPWLAHGHISPFAVLANRLIHRNFHVFLCSTPVNLEPFRKSINHPSLEFVDLHLSSTELPEKHHTTKNLPTHLMPTLKTAFIESKETFRNILKTIKPDILVYDFMQPWASEMASEEGISSIVLFPCGAACTSCIVHYAIQPHFDYSKKLLETSPNSAIHRRFFMVYPVSQKMWELVHIEKGGTCMKLALIISLGQWEARSNFMASFGFPHPVAPSH